MNPLVLLQRMHARFPITDGSAHSLTLDGGRLILSVRALSSWFSVRFDDGDFVRPDEEVVAEAERLLVEQMVIEERRREARQTVPPPPPERPSVHDRVTMPDTMIPETEREASVEERAHARRELTCPRCGADVDRTSQHERDSSNDTWHCAAACGFSFQEVV